MERESQFVSNRPNSVDDRLAGEVFVGRGREFDALRAGFRDAVEGKGRLFTVSGDPGIGKTTLAGALAEHARSQGARVFWGRCWEAGGAPAYWPWVQVLRELAGAGQPTPELPPTASDLAELVT
jgi:eukaryotic-like serine/threonine-protein kinase